MAKEMMIVFVYDTLRCLSEADDPAEAVLYFHPDWVSDSQRLALCGQLMGVTHCLKALFSSPRVLALQSGKFVVQEYGRYVLAIGSDRNIPDWMLMNRAEILTSLIRVYHCDLQTVAAQFPGENNPRFAEKLYQMFGTYLPILQYGGYMFQTVPILDLPKSATNIFLECMQILEYCQRTKGVLGGTILYNNKIVVTQLNSKLTSRLAMVDPYRIKSPAETFTTDYDLPNGTQLLVVYIKKKYYKVLQTDAKKIQDWHENGFDKLKRQKIAPKPAKEPALGMMKRDKSLLFTAVPEEEITTATPSPCTSPQGSSDNVRKPSTRENSPKHMSIPDVVPFSSKPRVRPNKLALSFKNSVSRDSIDEDNAVPAQKEPIFTGQTSVCSTPMLEFKTLHGNVMSICRNSDDQLLTEALNFPATNEAAVVNTAQENNVTLLEKVIETNPVDGTRKTSNDFKVLGENSIAMPMYKMKRFKSLSDINSGFQRISQLAMMRFGKSAVKKNLSLNSDDSPGEDENEKVNVTISDPCYPVFRSDGVPISKTLFNEYLSQHYKVMDKKPTEDLSKPLYVFKPSKKTEKEHLEGFDSDMVPSPSRRKSYDVNIGSHSSKASSGLPARAANPVRRKSLSLPLKSLGENADANLPSSLLESQSNRMKHSGVQLTPLMEKLSLLAFSEKSSGYSSRGITPMEFKDFTLSTPLVEKTIIYPAVKSDNNKNLSSSCDTDSDSDDDLHSASFSIDCVKCTLLVCGLQNMAMLLLMDEDAPRDPGSMQALSEASLARLEPIEQMCMKPLPSSAESMEAYSYLLLDPQWGAVKQGGPWASSDTMAMGYIHKHFRKDPSLTEVIIRNEESLVLGTSCGGAEVYYQEAGGKQAGLPTPADLLGAAPLKAKRRLQRDHSITIF